MPRGRRNVSTRKRTSTPVTVAAPAAAVAPAEAAPAPPVPAYVGDATFKRALEHLRSVEEVITRLGGPAAAALAGAQSYRARLVEIGERVVEESAAGRLPGLPESVFSLVSAAGQLRPGRSADKDAAARAGDPGSTRG